MKKNFFQEVYPFATENMNAYFERLELSDKNVLTVGSSCDQLFNAIVYGAKSVTVFDINSNVKKYYEWKKRLLFQCKRENFAKTVLQKIKYSEIPFTKDILDIATIYRMNHYLENDDIYRKLQHLLLKTPVFFVEGDLFAPNIKKQYDRIIFSNVLQYVDSFFPGNHCSSYQVIRDTFMSWQPLLNEEGILQFLYLYSFRLEDLKDNGHSIACYNIKPIYELLKEYRLEIEWVSGIGDKPDAILTYTNKTNERK